MKLDKITTTAIEFLAHQEAITPEQLADVYVMSDWEIRHITKQDIIIRAYRELRIIRDKIMNEMDWLIHTANEQYFKDLKLGKVRLTVRGLYLPAGRGVRLGGLRRATTKDDPIYIDSMNRAAAHDRSSSCKHIYNVIDAHRHGLLSDDAAKNLNYNIIKGPAEILVNGILDGPVADMITNRTKLQALL